MKNAISVSLGITLIVFLLYSVGLFPLIAHAQPSDKLAGQLTLLRAAAGLDGQLDRSGPGLGAIERLDDGEKNGRLT